MSRSTIPIVALGLVVLAAVGLVFFWDAIPGTFYRDANGFPHGAGRSTYHYKSGPVMLIEDWSRGKMNRSEWFRPNGTSVMVTLWKKGPCQGIYLREDGTIRTRMTYANEIAEGPATYYAGDGTTVIGEAIFKDGVRVSGYDPRKPKE